MSGPLGGDFFLTHAVYNFSVSSLMVHEVSLRLSQCALMHNTAEILMKKSLPLLNVI